MITFCGLGFVVRLSQSTATLPRHKHKRVGSCGREQRLFSHFSLPNHTEKATIQQQADPVLRGPMPPMHGGWWLVAHATTDTAINNIITLTKQMAGHKHAFMDTEQKALPYQSASTIPTRQPAPKVIF